MDEIILTSSTADLATIISLLFVPADALMFLERAPSHRLSEAEIANGIKLTAYDNTINLTQWERGKIFCRAWELRWENMRAVYTGTAVALPGFVAGQDLSACARRRASYYLWGMRDGQRFIELQIARELYYPTTSGNRVKLVVAEWFDRAGEMVASRFIGLEAV